jgi:hypothetical protein
MSVEEHKAKAKRSIRCFVLTVSDTRDEATDTSGQLIKSQMGDEKHQLAGYKIVKDEPAEIESLLRKEIANPEVEAIIVNGGTLDIANYNPIGNITLNGGILNNRSFAGAPYQGYVLLGDVNVTGTAASVMQNSAGSTDGNHLNINTNFNVGSTGAEVAAGAVAGAVAGAPPQALSAMEVTTSRAIVMEILLLLILSSFLSYG